MYESKLETRLPYYDSETLLSLCLWQKPRFSAMGDKSNFPRSSHIFYLNDATQYR